MTSASASASASAGARPLTASRIGGLTWRTPAAAALMIACVAGVVALFRVFVLTAHGQLVDEATRDGGSTGGHAAVASTVTGILDVVSATTLVVAMVVVVGIALVQRRYRQALGAAVLLAGSTLTTQLLKHVLLERPTLAGGTWPQGNSFPSGHTTFAASVSAAVILAVPAAWRPTAAVVGALWSAATGAATLAEHWHRASDVAAAVLVVGAWTAAVVIALELGPRQVSHRSPISSTRVRRTGLVSATGLLTLGTAFGLGMGVPILAVVWEHTPPGLHTMFGLHVAFVGGALAVGGLTCLVMGCLLHLLDHPLDGARRSTALRASGLAGLGEALSSSGAPPASR